MSTIMLNRKLAEKLLDKILAERRITPQEHYALNNAIQRTETFEHKPCEVCGTPTEKSFQTNAHVCVDCSH